MINPELVKTIAVDDRHVGGLMNDPHVGRPVAGTTHPDGHQIDRKRRLPGSGRKERQASVDESRGIIRVAQDLDLDAMNPSAHDRLGGRQINPRAQCSTRL